MWTRRPDLSYLGNAGEWKANAERKGVTTGPASAPVAGAVAWWSSSNPSTAYVENGQRVNYGHVAYVERVQGGTFLVSEMNWPTWNVRTQRWITPGGRGAPDGFIYGDPAGPGPSTPTDRTAPGATSPDTIGAYDQGLFYLRNSNSGGDPSIPRFAFGHGQAIAGDWDGGGVDTIGTYHEGCFYLRNSNSGAIRRSRASRSVTARRSPATGTADSRGTF